LEMYFAQSEQLKTRLWLFANETDAAGLFIQELPEQATAWMQEVEQRREQLPERAAVYDQDAWDRIEILANTITSQEILDLDAEQLLHRLFHEEQVRLFDAEPVAFYCRCSRPVIERTLRAMGRTELEDILQEQGAIEVDCEFCGKHYSFDPVDVEAILVPDGVSTPSSTRH